jgi:hypothetical protein
MIFIGAIQANAFFVSPPPGKKFDFYGVSIDENCDKYSVCIKGAKSVHSCQGLPMYAHWVQSDSNTCKWECNTDYEKIGNKCITYDWQLSGWTNCSKTCGGGTQSNSYVCKNNEGAVVNNSKCVDLRGLKPSNLSRSCNLQACYCKFNGTDKFNGVCKFGN